MGTWVSKLSYGQPWEAEDFEWDDDNEGELAGHSISPEEVHQVWENGPFFVPNKKQGSGDWKMLGTTHGGRRLTIILAYDSRRRRVRPITGWKAEGADLARYF